MQSPWWSRIKLLCELSCSPFAFKNTTMISCWFIGSPQPKVQSTHTIDIKEASLLFFLKYIFRGQNANDIFISIFIYSIHPADWPYNPVNCLNAGCSLIKCFLKEHGELRDILMLVAQNNLIFFAASSLKALNPKVWIQYEVTSASAPVFSLSH